ncbi:hypothetical protein Rfer_1203 [Rhodoferax ferrireducens T118]|uniref:Uncharacterized protein n=1 Tax=Albidiferax ferrireducens (strain ATCC BAA-621 / DSM 15236 / T118) TaxID=338969 RepID=Q21Z65_ALBFT|nr:hypothetical protein [Rhodoferax ferrireducens]ABD68938.1 hypothetical protein Rfer_1203 [Rhodoferax ferrireducens T118]
MTDINKNEAERLIAQFLSEHEHPTTKDWKALVNKYPQHASNIADAAIVRMAGDAADASDEDYVFDAELASRTVSKALSRFHQVPSHSLESAQQKVNSLKGAARKGAAQKIGIGPYATLLNGVLSGRTKAPGKLLDALSAFFEEPATALAEVFRRNFATTPVPAFKAGHGKPKLATQPNTWEESVREQDLSAEETARLLKFADEK